MGFTIFGQFYRHIIRLFSVRHILELYYENINLDQKFMCALLRFPHSHIVFSLPHMQLNPNFTACFCNCTLMK